VTVREEGVSTQPVLTGLRVGVVVAAAVLILAVVGLTSSFLWVPEVPLLLVAVLVPVLGYGFAGYRAASSSRRAADGLVAGAVAGTLSGAIGGLSYVAFGKPLLNALVGPLIGAVGGAVVGVVAALLTVRGTGRRP
jgi:hypothetical protein